MAITALGKEISKYVVGTGENRKVYYFKDAAARAAISAGLQYVVADTLPTASADTMGKIYLIPAANTNHVAAAGNNVKVEYITVKNGDNSYAWEMIGDTDIDLSDYAHLSHTHKVTAAGTNAESAVSFDKTDDKVLGADTTFKAADSTVSGSATVTGGNQASNVTFEDNETNKAQAISALPASTVPAYKIADATKQKLSASASGADVNTVSKYVVADNTKFGNVTAGSDAQLDGGSVASFTQGAKASYTQGAKAQWEASVDESAEELSFSFTPNGDDTFVANGDDSFTANTLQSIKEGTGKATVVTLPEFAEQTIATSMKSQPAITVALGETGDVDVVTAQGALSTEGTNAVSFGEAQKVDVVKIGATGSAAAQTWAQATGTISGTAAAQAISIDSADEVTALTAISNAKAAAQVFTGSEVSTGASVAAQA